MRASPRPRLGLAASLNVNTPFTATPYFACTKLAHNCLRPLAAALRHGGTWRVVVLVKRARGAQQRRGRAAVGRLGSSECDQGNTGNSIAGIRRRPSCSGERKTRD